MKKYIGKIKYLLIFYMIITIIGEVFFSLIPYFTKTLFDGDRDTAIIGYTVCLLSFVFTAYIGNLTQAKFNKKFMQNLRKDYFGKVINQSNEKFKKKPVGEYLSYQVNDIQEVNNSYLQPIIAIWVSVIRIIVFFVTIYLTLGMEIGLILLGTAVVGSLLPKSLAKRTAKYRKENLKQKKIYFSKIEEYLNGHNLVDERTQENIMKQHNEELEKSLHKGYKQSRVGSLMWALNGLSAMSINYVAFIYLGYLTYRGEISPGFAIAVFGYASLLNEPMHTILYYRSLLSSSKDVVKSYTEFVSKENIVKKELVKDFNTIEINNLNKEFENFNLNISNLTLEKGLKYAIIGSNGSGKTTLIKMLASKIDEYDGDILINDKHINTLNTTHLIGLISQDEYMYSDTFKNNTTMFNSYENIENNVLLDEVKSLTDTKNCNELSGGQKRKIMLYRLFNKNTPIILLDEPLYSIDDSSKENIIKNIMNQDKTIISITHDMGDSLNQYDKIILMKKGELIEVASYDTIKEHKEYKMLIKEVKA